MKTTASDILAVIISAALTGGVILVTLGAVSLCTGCAHQTAAQGPTRAECDRDTLWVDRIEGDWAVLMGMDGTSIDVRVSALPESLREGEVIRDGQRDHHCTAVLRETTTAALMEVTR